MTAIPLSQKAAGRRSTPQPPSARRLGSSRAYTLSAFPFRTADGRAHAAAPASPASAVVAYRLFRAACAACAPVRPTSPSPS